jgi:hypothetical protein
MFGQNADGSAKYVRYHGAQFVYELKPGESWIVSGALIVITHPSKSPKVVHPDGAIEELAP